MSYKQISPVTVPEGATEVEEFTEFSVIVAGSSGDSSFQQAIPVATTTAILTSNGLVSAPSFHTPPIPQFRFQLLAADPGAPINGQVWYNTTTNLFRGVKNSSILTFDVT